MSSLCTVVKAEDVSEEYKKEASAWEIWESGNQTKFSFDYATEEKTLIIEGSATLQPSEKGAESIPISAGDKVVFHAGFKCKWTVTEPMKKYYTVAEEPAKVEPQVQYTAAGRPIRNKRAPKVIDEEVPESPPKKKKTTKKATKPAAKKPSAK